MQPNGAEEKLQALFRELKRENEQLAPDFAQILSNAKTKKGKMIPFRFAFGVLTTSLCALVMFVWFSQTKLPEVLESVAAFPEKETTVFIFEISEHGKRNIYLPQRQRANSLSAFQARVIRKDILRKKEIHQQKKSVSDLIAWKSPTSSLLQIPLQGLLKKVSIEEPKLILGPER